MATKLTTATRTTIWATSGVCIHANLNVIPDNISKILWYFKTSYSSGTEEIEIFKLYNISFSSYGYLHFVFDKCDNYFNFWNIFHSRLAASLSAASRWGQCDVFMHRPIAAVWPDWAIYWILGKFLKPLATINLPKSPTFLGYWCQNHSFFQ